MRHDDIAVLGDSDSPVTHPPLAPPPHRPDDHFDQALSGAYRALADLKKDGTIGAIGAGMNQAAMLARFARRESFDCFLVAGRYTLLDQSAIDELLPECSNRGISIII